MESQLFRLNNKNILRVKTDKPAIKKFINDYLFFTFQTLSIKKGPLGSCRKDKIFDLEIVLSKKNKSGRCLDLTSRKHNQLIAFESSRSRSKFIFHLYASDGSFSKVDYYKRRVSICLKGPRVSLNTPSEFLIHKTIVFLRLYFNTLRIHAAWLKKNRDSVLLIGRSGAGKTTITKVFNTFDRQVKIMEDDNIYINTFNENPDILSPPSRKLYPVTSLVFVEREESAHSRIYPISSKEAFKRILFHADVIFSDHDEETDNRMSILCNLVARCRAYSLLNGDDLKGNLKVVSNIFNCLLNGKKP